MDKRILAEYSRLRSLGWRAKDAIDAARTLAQFERLEILGLVKLAIEPEQEQYDASYVDTWDLSERRREAAKKEIMDRVASEGTYFVMAMARASESDEFLCVDSCGGFIGDDWIDSGYDVDLRRAAVERCAP